MLREQMVLDHINRYVSSVDALVAFYTDALGFALLDAGVKKDGHKYAILHHGGLEMFISEKDGFTFDAAANLRHIGFRVDSADALMAQLKKKGYLPADQRVIVKAFSRQFYMKDPDGFELDFIEWTDKGKFYEHLRSASSSDGD